MDQSYASSEASSGDVTSSSRVSSIDDSQLSSIFSPQQLAQLTQKLQQNQQLTQLNQQLQGLQGSPMQLSQLLQLGQMNAAQQSQQLSQQLPTQLQLMTQQAQLQSMTQQPFGMSHHISQLTQQNTLSASPLQQLQQQMSQQQMTQQQMSQQQMSQQIQQQMSHLSPQLQQQLLQQLTLQQVLQQTQSVRPLTPQTPSSVRLPAVSLTSTTPQHVPRPTRVPIQPTRPPQIRPWAPSATRLVSGTSLAGPGSLSSTTQTFNNQLNSASVSVAGSSFAPTGPRQLMSATAQPLIGQSLPSFGLSANQNALQLATLLTNGNTAQAIQLLTQLQLQQQQMALSSGLNSQPLGNLPCSGVSNQCAASTQLSNTSSSSSGPPTADGTSGLSTLYSRLPQGMTQMAVSSEELTNHAQASIPVTGSSTNDVSPLISLSFSLNPGGLLAGNQSENSDSVAMNMLKNPSAINSMTEVMDTAVLPSSGFSGLESFVNACVGENKENEGDKLYKHTAEVESSVPVVSGSSGNTGKQTARVMPQILTHVIEGFVIKEGPEPFPICRSSFLCESLDSSDELSDETQEDETYAQRKNSGGSTEEELSIKCAFCGTTVVINKSNSKVTRFCSTSCAKRCAASTRWMVYRSMHGSKNGNTKRGGARNRSSTHSELIGGASTSVTAVNQSAADVLHTAVTASTSAAAAAAAEQVVISEVPVTPVKRINVNKSSPVRSPPPQIIPSNQRTDNTAGSSPLANMNTTGSASQIRSANQRPDNSAGSSPVANTSQSPGSQARVTPGSQARLTAAAAAEDEIVLPACLTQKHPSKWGVSDVHMFVMALPGCSVYAEEFKSQEIDGQALLLLKEEHLMSSLGLKLGPALKICSQISALRDSFNN